MEVLQKSRVAALLGMAAWLSLWLLGCAVNFLDAWRGSVAMLPLRQSASLRLPAPLSPPFADGRGGLCLQDAAGRISHFAADGQLVWQAAPPEHFSLVSVQSAPDYLVLTSHWGQAVAINDDGTERWRFEPVHHEMERALQDYNPGEAVFYSMACALVYGLDERGVQQWVRHIPSATTANSQHPWLWRDGDGNLQTRCNYGRIRVDSGGEIQLIDNELRCDAQVLDVSADGRLLSLGTQLRISDPDGEQIGQGMQAGARVERSAQSWLTRDGYASIDAGTYRRLDSDGEELRSEVLPGTLLAAGRLADEQLYLCSTEGSMEGLHMFPAVLASMLGSGSYPDLLAQGRPLVVTGRKLTLGAAATSVPVRVPRWLESGEWSMYGLGDAQLLFMKADGELRICSLQGRTP